MTAEHAAQAFYNGELELELRRLGKVNYPFKADGDREKCFEMIEMIRRESIYDHPESECSPQCKKRGTCSHSIVSVYISCKISICFRLWQTLGDRRCMEASFSTLHVSSGGMLLVDLPKDVASRNLCTICFGRSTEWAAVIGLGEIRKAYLIVAYGKLGCSEQHWHSR